MRYLQPMAKPNSAQHMRARKRARTAVMELSSRVFNIYNYFLISLVGLYIYIYIYDLDIYRYISIHMKPDRFGGNLAGLTHN